MKRLLAAIESLAALFLLAIALLTAGNVLLRDVFAVQIPDWFDVSKMLQAIALFWGIAIATHAGRHIHVDLLWERLGTRGRHRMDLAATVLSLLLLGPLAWMVWVKVMKTGTQTTMDLQLPLVWFYAVAATGGTAILVLALVRIRMLAVALREGRPVDGGDDLHTESVSTRAVDDSVDDPPAAGGRPPRRADAPVARALVPAAGAVHGS